MEDVLRLKKQLTRTRVVVFILLTFCLLFFIFAYVQMLEANRQELLAIANLTTAKQATEEAERQRAIALHERTEALIQKDLSEESISQSGNSLETVEQLKKELTVQRKIAEQNQTIALKNEAQAKRMELLAQQNVQRAIAAEVAAKKALEDCQKKTN